ncbi:hypothetical protein B0H17DRAFT_1044866 [Mycena rosella]|uniref:Uncharacterized protein n=1 Tax=Mycena rosella TaxID=1033263 RepID=A0AAD7DX19_MYCRO|nr:hypothetical protein B0H17DRAFT_1044866 [Mycena rosella]
MFRTRSQLPTAFPAARPIYVKKYSLYDEETSQRDLLRIAHSASGHDTLWIKRDDIFRGTPSRRVIPPTTFELAPGPPRSNTKRSPPQLTEWNADIHTDDDPFNLDELEEFKSTDLSFLMLKRPHSEEPADTPPLKRRKLDVASLRDMIPQPHVMPSPMAPSTKTKSVPAYSKSKPIPIPPHTIPLPAPPPYSRRSWVIPVRGALPWRHATSAVLLLDSTDPPDPPDPKTHEEIAWTAPALREFWSFLLSVRDLHAVGLSFNVSSQDWSYSSSQPTYTEISGMGGQPQSVSSAAAPSVVSSARQGIGTMPLSFLDHIKVYHDAAHSMSIRTILDVWPFEPGGRKIRLLKGARLVLLDERSKGVLIS